MEQDLVLQLRANAPASAEDLSRAVDPGPAADPLASLLREASLLCPEVPSDPLGGSRSEPRLILVLAEAASLLSSWGNVAGVRAVSAALFGLGVGGVTRNNPPTGMDAISGPRPVGAVGTSMAITPAAGVFTAPMRLLLARQIRACAALPTSDSLCGGKPNAKTQFASIMAGLLPSSPSADHESAVSAKLASLLTGARAGIARDEHAKKAALREAAHAAAAAAAAAAIVHVPAAKKKSHRRREPAEREAEAAASAAIKVLLCALMRES